MENIIVLGPVFYNKIIFVRSIVLASGIFEFGGIFIHYSLFYTRLFFSSSLNFSLVFVTADQFSLIYLFDLTIQCTEQQFNLSI
jgi:hypothetical protein